MFVVPPPPHSSLCNIYIHTRRREGGLALSSVFKVTRVPPLLLCILHSLERDPCYKYTSDQEGKGHG